MESIKHKMTVLAQETEAANQRGREATAAAHAEEEKAENFEDEVLKAQKKVSFDFFTFEIALLGSFSILQKTKCRAEFAHRFRPKTF